MPKLPGYDAVCYFTCNEITASVSISSNRKLNLEFDKYCKIVDGFEKISAQILTIFWFYIKMAQN